MDFTANDFPLLKRCLTERWSASPEQRRAALDHMALLASNFNDPKTAVKAFKALVEAERLDLDAVRVAVGAAAVKVLAGTTAQAPRIDAGPTDDDLREGVARLLAPARDAIINDAPVQAPVRVEVA